MALNMSAGHFSPGAGNRRSGWTSSSQASHSRMPISSGTIEPYAMTGSGSTYSTVSPRCRTLRPAGYGPTITSDRTWDLAVSPQNRSWPWWPRLYFWAQRNMGGLPRFIAFLQSLSLMMEEALIGVHSLSNHWGPSLLLSRKTGKSGQIGQFLAKG